MLQHNSSSVASENEMSFEVVEESNGDLAKSERIE